MFIIQKQTFNWTYWDVFTKVVSDNVWVHIMQDVNNECWWLFKEFKSTDEWTIDIDVDGIKLHQDESENYKRVILSLSDCDIEWRWREYNVESDYLFFNLFE